MAELSHVWGNDLALGPTGDLAMVSGLEEGRQRVLRRLLTTLENYIWHLDYGASLPLAVGRPTDALAIEGAVRRQLALEACVAATPEATVAVSTDGSGGSILQVTYQDRGTGQRVALSSSIGLNFGRT